MRKLVFFTFVAAGGAVGALTAIGDGIGVSSVMAAIGAIVGTVLGGVIARIGVAAIGRSQDSASMPFGQGTSARDRVRNFWRDRGHPPFMKPSEGPPDRHMMDVDRQD